MIPSCLTQMGFFSISRRCKLHLYFFVSIFNLLCLQHYSIHSWVGSVFPTDCSVNSSLAERKHIESTHSLLSHSPCLRRCPRSSASKSSWLAMPGYGVLPLDTISHMVTPKDHCRQLKTVKESTNFSKGNHPQKCILTVIFRTDHITLAGVHGFRKALYGHPLDWHSDSNLLSVIVSAADLLGQAEVSHTYMQIISQPACVGDEWERNMIQIALVCCNMKCSEMSPRAYMQLRAAKSRCKKPLELRYSMPVAMSIIKRSRLWSGTNWNEIVGYKYHKECSDLLFIWLMYQTASCEI